MGESSSKTLMPKVKFSDGPSSRLAGNYLDPSTLDRLYVSVLVSAPPNSTLLTALVDSGSDLTLMDMDTAIAHDLLISELPAPLKMETIDGTVLPSGSPTKYVDVDLLVNGSTTSARCYLIRSPHAPLILGLDWLKKTTPSIDWSTMTLRIPDVDECSEPKPLADSQGCSVSCLTTSSRSPIHETAFELTSDVFASVTPLCQGSAVCPRSLKADAVTCVTVASPEQATLDEGTVLSTTPLDNPAECFDQYLDDIESPEPELLKSLPSEYSDFVSLFSPATSELLPEHRPYDISIELQPGTSPPWGPIYALSNPELEALKKYLDEELAKGFIRPSKSPAAAPIFFVKKKSGELRPVVDYRGLNKITVKNRYPLPLINEMLTRFNHAKVFSKIDLRGAYNLVRIKPGDEWKTAFRTRYGLFEYLVMPFGLTNAPSVFQHLMNDIFRDLLDVYCVIYIDDILIYSETLEDHKVHVRTILQRLKDNNLYSKIEKCIFHASSVEFLGYVVSSNGISMEPSRVKAIRDWPTPRSIKDIQKFLGFANFYRMFVPNYSKTIVPITQLLKKDVPFEWTADCTSAFELLKDKFTSSPILAHADTSKPFYVETDASDFALGGVLSQIQESDGELHPIAFYSRKFAPAEINYPIYDKELLAVIACFYQWRPFLLGSVHPTIVFTDHRNLEYFTTAKSLNRRQIRWSLFLADYDFTIVYRPATEGGKPDALSRISDYSDPDNKEFLLLPKERFLTCATVVSEDLLTQILRAQKDLDPDFIQTMMTKGLVKRDQALMFDDRIFVPDELRLEVLKLHHDSLLAGHFGNRKTFARLSKSFWWPTIRKDCSSYVNSCQTCSMAKPSRHKPFGLLKPLPIPPRPWHSISMDMITDLPLVDSMDSILVVVDRFTKMAHFLPCSKTLNSTALADLFVKEIFRLHGLPADIVSDRGSIFVSQFWQFLMKNLGIKQKLSSAYHPETDGQTEKVNDTLEQYLRCYSNYLQTNWVKLLPLAEFAYNSAVHDSSKFSPFVATYGYEPPLDLSTEILPETPPTTELMINRLKENFEIITQELSLAQQTAKRFADKTRQDFTFNVGDMVYLNRKNIKTTRPSLKLDWKKLGPFKIAEKLSDVAYRLELPTSMKRLHNVFHISLLSPMHTSDLPGRVMEPPPPIEVAEELEYEVSEILDYKLVGKTPYYLVSWVGYGPAENTWEPLENLNNCSDLVKTFHENYPERVELALKGSRRGKLLGLTTSADSSLPEDSMSNRDMEHSTSFQPIRWEENT